jgi:hypothetical protein
MTLQVDGTWDIECAEWDRFVVGRWLSVSGETYESWNSADFFGSLCQRRGVWYAHAGGRYDVLWLLTEAAERGIRWSARLRGSGILSVRIGAAEFRDSHAIVPLSLSKAAGLAGSGVQKGSVGLACECGKACPGFCALARPLTGSERAKVSEYLYDDCRVLLAVLDAVDARTRKDGIDLGLTVGGSAWKTAAEWCGLPKCEHDVSRYRRIREGYYGGRVEVFQTRASAGHRYDIHSSYPAALARTALPIGTPAFRTGGKAGADYASGKPGIYAARVCVREANIPPLPVRTKDRLIYPYGSFCGVWTGLELRYAQTAGAKVEAVEWAYVWRASAAIVAPFARRVWRLRDEAAGAGEKSWAGWYKFLANSLTGKFAQQPEHESLLFVPFADPLPEGDLAVLRVGKAGTFLRVSTPPRIDACAHAEWAAYLTAEARTELHRQLVSADVPLYCDTDSVYSIQPQIRRIGDELGEWGYEGGLTDWRALAPKVYRYRAPDGSWHVRGKGFPGLDYAGFDALESGHDWHVTAGVMGARSALRGGDRMFVRNRLSRALHPTPGWCGGRLHPAGSNVTFPVTMERYAMEHET